MGSAYPLTGRSILVVEDEPLISMEMTALFESAGAKVRQARTVAEAAGRTDGVSAAVLDYRLGEENAPALCALLTERHIPFMFYSGYADLEKTYPGALVIPKPSSANALLVAMAGLVVPRAARLPSSTLNRCLRADPQDR
jgi:response regulator RpfG family c-di-GMP phosphodiesterase